MTVIEDSFLIPVSNYRGGKKTTKYFDCLFCTTSWSEKVEKVMHQH